MMKDKNYVRLGQIYQFLQKKNNQYIADVSKFEMLIENDFDVNYQLPIDSLICQKNPKYIGNTALHFVAEHYQDCCSFQFYDQYLQVLFKHGANVTIKNNDSLTPLLLAFNNEPTVDYHYLYNQSLLSLASLNYNNATNICSTNNLSHFHVLCTTDNVELVELFLRSGASINERVKDDSPKHPGYTPLHFSVLYSRLKTIKLLMNYGADLNAKDACGVTPMHLIVKNFVKDPHLNMFVEKQNFFKNAILNSAFNHQPDNLGFCHLHLASVLIDHTILIDQFLNQNVDVDSPIKFDSPIWPGCTPLHLASQSLNLKTVISLLEKKANILAKDANGITSLDLILEKFNFNQIINILSSEKQYQLSQLKLTDGTYLLDVIKAIKVDNQPENFKVLIHNIKTVNTFIPFNSPVWPGYNLLHLQVLFNDPSECLLVNHNIDFTMLNTDGMSPLHLAFRKMRCQIVTQIINSFYKIPANIIDQDNLSHLHIACVAIKYNVKPIEYLLKNGCDPNIPTLCDIQWSFDKDLFFFKSGSTPLHIAAYKKNLRIINELLSYGANPSLADVAGVTPFQILLAQLSKLPIDRTLESLLIKMWENYDKDLLMGKRQVDILCTALLMLNSYKHVELFRKIVSEFDCEKWFEELGLSRLQVACVTDDIEVMKKELESGADVNATVPLNSPLWPGDTTLHIFSRKFRRNKINMIDLLIKHGADFTIKNAENQTPYHLNEFIYQENFKYLFHINRSNFTSVNPINNEGMSHFHIACRTNEISLVEEFLKSGVDVNSCIDYFASYSAGFTPLHFLVGYIDNKSMKIIELLLSHGADPNISNAEGSDTWHYALSHCDNILDKSLFRCSVINVHSMNIYGETAMDIIFKELEKRNEPYYRDLIKERIVSIVQWGYELCYKDNKGKTALHKSTNPCSIRFLLSLGADVNIRDDSGKTCIQYVSEDNKTIKRIFTQHIQLLKVAGVYIDNLNEINLDPCYEMFLSSEIRNLNNELKKNVGPSFSLDYFFSDKFVVNYKKLPISKRKAIHHFCFSNNRFEHYNFPIMLPFMKARARTRLIERAESAFKILVNRFPPDCLEFIFDYLNNDDLMNLIRAVHGKLKFAPLLENFDYCSYVSEFF